MYVNISKYITNVNIIWKCWKCEQRMYVKYVYSCFEKGCPTEKQKAYATIPKGMMGCGCSLLHRHEFSAR